MGAPGAAAPSSYSVNYDALLSTTFFAYRQKMVDNIFKSNAFLTALKEMDGIEYQDGGERIMQPLMYEVNDTVKSYRGYEQLEVKPQDGITSAFFEWGEVAGTIAISRREERQNSGEAALLRLLQKKIEQAEMSLKTAINKMLVQGTVSASTFVPGNDVKDLYPLGYFFRGDPATDPTTGGSVGNLNAATYSWWRSRAAGIGTNGAKGTDTFTLNCTTYAAIVLAFRRMYNYCTRGADGTAPNLILGDQVTFETYENALDTKVRYTDTKFADMGFDNLKVKGATFIWDELVPDIQTGTAALTKGTAWFLNTKFYKLVIDKQTDFITSPFAEPENQTAKVAKVLFMGNATISNPRKCGVMYDIAQNIAA